ncbi:MAG: hypothetical protein ABFD11_13610 [Christensenella sp.]
MKRSIALLLSIIMFLGVISYSSVALADELDTVQVTATVTEETPADPPAPSVVVIEPIDTEGANGYEYTNENGEMTTVSNNAADETNIVSESVVADDKYMENPDGAEYTENAAQNTTEDFQNPPAGAGNTLSDEVVDQLLDDTAMERNVDAEYRVDTTSTEISADKTAVTVTGEVVVETADGEMSVPNGAIEVTLSADSLGSAKIFEQTEEGYQVKEKGHVVLTIDITSSMKQYIDSTEQGVAPEAKWAVLCEAVKAFVETVYNVQPDTNGDYPALDPVNAPELQLVFYSGINSAGFVAPEDMARVASNLSAYYTKTDGTADLNLLLSLFTGNYDTDIRTIDTVDLAMHTEIVETGNMIKVPISDFQEWTTDNGNGHYDFDGKQYIKRKTDGKIFVFEQIGSKPGIYINGNWTEIKSRDFSKYYGESAGGSGNYKFMKYYREYDEVPETETIVHSNLEVYEPGTNNPAGYNVALQAVQGIIADNGGDPNFEASNITVVYMTDGEVTCTLVRDAAGNVTNVNKGMNYLGSQYQQIGGASAAHEAALILDEGAKLVNIVINNEHDNDMAVIESYMKPGAGGYLDAEIDALNPSGDADYVMGSAAYIAAQSSEEVVDAYRTIAETIIRELAVSALVAYNARVIDVVPVGFDVMFDKDSGLTIAGTDAEGNRIIVWEIGDMVNEGHYESAYFLIPNGKLGENYQYGTAFTNDSAILYCKPIANNGDEIAIVLDRPVTTVGATAKSDHPTETAAATFGTFSFDLRENDSVKDLKAIVANGTVVTDTWVNGISNILAAINGTPVTANLSGDMQNGWSIALSDADGALGTLTVDNTGKAVFTPETGRMLLTSETLAIDFDYELAFKATINGEEYVLPTEASAKLELVGTETEAPTAGNPNPAPGPNPGATVVLNANAEIITDEGTPLAAPDDPDQDTSSVFNENAELISDEDTPLAGSTWALLNLILTIVTALGIISIFMLLKKRREVAMTKWSKAFHWSTLVPAIGAVVAFLLTEDMSNPMVLTDKWTILMSGIAVVQALVVVFIIQRNNREM